MGTYRYCFILFLLHFCVAQAATPNIPLQLDVEPPALLSETGLYSGNVAELKPAEGLRTYEINQSLFVDHAQKKRMFYLPENRQIGFSPDKPYTFPVGMILVKHFQMETSKGIFQNLETRVLVRKEGEDQQNWVGYTYEWSGSDARLVSARASPEVSLTIDETAVGGARQQIFKIPNRRQCLMCHNSSVGYVRSMETMQLHRLNNSGANQLAEFNQAGIFNGNIGNLINFDRFADISDESEPLEKRVKSYIAVNCSHCHNPDPGAFCNFVGLDLRFDSFNASQLVQSGHLVRGSRESSSIFTRMDSLRPGMRMPFIGTQLKDESALDVIGRWIDSL